MALSHWLNDELQLLGDLSWSGWSRLPSLRVRRKADDAILSDEILGYQDSFRIGLGLQYRYDSRFKLRSGIAWDQSPIRNAQDRTSRLPDADRIWLALGANYQFSQQTSIDLGYAYVFFDHSAINRATNANSMLQVVRGSFETSANIVSIQLNQHF